MRARRRGGRRRRRTGTISTTSDWSSGVFVFADTSALVARFVERDANHGSADRESRRLLREGRRFLTTNYVFDEVVTRVRTLAGYESSRIAGDALLTSRTMQRLYLDEEWERRAWAFYQKYGDQKLSFTDATSMVVMKARGIKEAFTFDSDFEHAGFVILPRPRRS